MDGIDPSKVLVRSRFPKSANVCVKYSCENSAGARTYLVSSHPPRGRASTAENVERGLHRALGGWAAAGMLSLPCTARVSKEHMFLLKSHRKTSF